MEERPAPRPDVERIFALRRASPQEVYDLGAYIMRLEAELAAVNRDGDEIVRRFEAELSEARAAKAQELTRREWALIWLALRELGERLDSKSPLYEEVLYLRMKSARHTEQEESNKALSQLTAADQGRK